MIRQCGLASRSSGTDFALAGKCLSAQTHSSQEIKKMLLAPSRSGSRCSTPHFPSIPFSFPPSLADGRELGDTGCRGTCECGAGGAGRLVDLVTAPLDGEGTERSFRC